jgi:tetratricopeptide (TPR) repeat protein
LSLRFVSHFTVYNRFDLSWTQSDAANVPDLGGVRASLTLVIARIFSEKRESMKSWLLLFAMALALSSPRCHAADVSAKTSEPAAITVSEGDITIPTYEHVGRYMQPPLFADSTLEGLYPFTTYKRQFKEGSPFPEKYHAIFVDNQYFKLTYIPELGGRFFSVYDKVHQRQMFYRNDVIKPTQFNARFTWPQSGIELTGPYDAHSLTWKGEPYWSHTILKHKDGSVSVLLGEEDPFYHMDVTYTATLYPNVDALEISTFCYNGTDGQKPQMLWSNAAFPVTPKTRFLYPMTQTVGHTTGVVSPWPIYNGVDLSWAHNNTHMLGVFGIDSYDNYGGSYEFDHDYGVFRYADRRVVQGMKMWTFGFGPGSSQVEHSYTDKAGPYFEAQSGRMVWDGHYEWVYPHEVEQWHEWWIPVAGINGLTTMSRDVALNVEINPGANGAGSSVELALSPVVPIQNATLVVTVKSRELLRTSVNLVPGTPVKKTIDNLSAADLDGLNVQILGPEDKLLLAYSKPATAPGGDVTPFAKDLTAAPVPQDKMTAEELVLAAEFKQKDLNTDEAVTLAKLALTRDPGYSAAHQLLGILEYNQHHYAQAAEQFQQAVDRNPYASESWYYLAICQLKIGQEKKAERNFYYVWPDSVYYGPREYQLGVLNLLRHDDGAAAQHLAGAINSNGKDIKAHLVLAVTLRDQGKKAEALEELATVEGIDPADRVVQAERFFLTGDATAKQKLRDLMGEQSESAIEVSIFYSSLERWKDAAAVLKMVEPPNNKDPWGTPPIYYYALAYNLKQAGDASTAAEYRKKAQAASGIVERFPYRAEMEAPLADAVKEDSKDTVARFDLACLLYYRGHQAEAMEQWEAINQIDPSDFSARRALGLAYVEDGKLDAAVPQLQKAVDLNPDSAETLDDLSDLYARTGKFAEQEALLQKAIAHNPKNDHLVEGLLNADLIQGKFQAAQDIIDHHTFLPVHRTYTLRDAYRELKYGQGAEAFNKGNFQEALNFFQSALKPPASLGMDDFELQSAPQIYYYIGRTYDAMGRKQEAEQAYKDSIRGMDQLTGGGSESYSPENFFMTFSLQRLGRQKEAETLMQQFQTVAESRHESSDPLFRARSYYLQALVAEYQGKRDEARKLMAQAVQVEPDYIGPRFELRGDAIDPMKETASH